MLKVAANQCATCIYRPNSPLDLAKLEREIADPRMKGFFTGYRICHSVRDQSSSPCCRGFWNQHKDHFTAGQIAQRIGMVEMTSRELDAD